MRQEDEKWEVYGNSPKIIMPREIMNKMFAYASFAKGEISGLGEVDIENGQIIIRDICLIKQECGSASTDFDPDALAKWNLEMLQAGKDTQKWKLWWHSHADMGVFFSGTDVQCAKDLLNCFGDFVVSVVVNRKGEVYGRLNYNLPPQGLFSNFSLVCEHCPIYIEDISTLDIEAIKAEIDEKVSEPRIISSAMGGYAGSQWDTEPHKSGHWDSDRREYVHDKREDVIWSSLTKAWIRDPDWKKKKIGIIEMSSDTPYGASLMGEKQKCEGCGEYKKTKLHFPSDSWLCKSCRKEWTYSTKGGFCG